jgi:GMP synthase-like glutamine amidotransferase
LKSSDRLAIAILRTDEVMPQFQPVHGDYPEMFEGLLERAARERKPPVTLEIDTFDVRVGQFPDPEDYDGLVITGSRRSVYDPEPWIAALADYLRTALDHGVKIVGICFGHQLLAHFFGGETAPAEAGWGVGVQESRIVSEEPWMQPPSERLNLLASHKDQVSRLPDGARVIASSDFCPVGGFVMGDQVMTVQGHPEFRREYSRDLMDMRRELLGEDVYGAGVASLDKETDEVTVGHWMLNFIAGSVSE